MKHFDATVPCLSCFCCTIIFAIIFTIHLGTVIGDVDTARINIAEAKKALAAKLAPPPPPPPPPLPGSAAAKKAAIEKRKATEAEAARVKTSARAGTQQPAKSALKQRPPSPPPASPKSAKLAIPAVTRPKSEVEYYSQSERRRIPTPYPRKMRREETEEDEEEDEDQYTEDEDDIGLKRLFSSGKGGKGRKGRLSDSELADRRRAEHRRRRLITVKRGGGRRRKYSEEEYEDEEEGEERKKRKKEKARRRKTFVEQIRKMAASRMIGAEVSIGYGKKKEPEKAKTKNESVPEDTKTEEKGKLCDKQCHRRKGHQRPTWCVQCEGRKPTGAETFALLSMEEHAQSKFAAQKMPVSFVLGFPLAPSPSGTFPAPFSARDHSPANPNLMTYAEPEGDAEEEEEVQEVQLTGTFQCGRDSEFQPEAVYLREFFWETGVRDNWETIAHPKWIKRIVGLYAVRPAFGSFTFKIVRPTASYQVHLDDKRRQKKGSKWKFGKEKDKEEEGMMKQDGEWPMFQRAQSQFELVFDRAGCERGGRAGGGHGRAETEEEEEEEHTEHFEDLCLREFARKADWQDREWRKALVAWGSCSEELLDKRNDRICVHRVGHVQAGPEVMLAEKSVGPIRVDKCTGREENEPAEKGKRARRARPGGRGGGYRTE